MALPDLFSRRKKSASAAVADVYSYTEISDKLRVQIVQIFSDAIGPYSLSFGTPPGKEVYEFIVRTLRREVGVFVLPPTRRADGDLSRELFDWFLNCQDIDHCIDFLELTCKILESHVATESYRFKDYVQIPPDEALEELNARMAEASFGFCYESNQIIQIDSKVLHAEVVRPALTLLADKAFAGPNEEYLAAHAAFRGREYETCIVECGKAFESTLKVIGASRRWPIKSTDPASKLLEAAYSTGFIEPILQAEFTALRALLQSGVPTVRNKLGGHGAGVAPRVVPPEVAAFQLHQTAAVIVFLVEHHRSLK